MAASFSGGLVEYTLNYSTKSFTSFESLSASCQAQVYVDFAAPTQHKRSWIVSPCQCGCSSCAALSPGNFHTGSACLCHLWTDLPFGPTLINPPPHTKKKKIHFNQTHNCSVIFCEFTFCICFTWWNDFLHLSGHTVLPVSVKLQHRNISF